jgi:NAD(P)-dependent dehydrogenase (short-subunit alcohol dehydrogenase family)
MTAAPPGKCLLVAGSSDIGLALAEAWARSGHAVVGTYRTWSTGCEDLQKRGVEWFPLSFERGCESGEQARRFLEAADGWDVVVFLSGEQSPVGDFADVPFAEWDRSIQVNFLSQLSLLHALLPHRNTRTPLGPLVIFFAGGGTNNAVVKYSAYTASKIGLIKMVELLDAEMPSVRFTIVGPGWVKTKIHETTLHTGAAAGANFEKTREMFRGGAWNPMEKVVACCNWLLGQGREVIGGRNFSIVHDAWGSPDLSDALQTDPSLYKLRRSGNERQFGRE